MSVDINCTEWLLSSSSKWNLSMPSNGEDFELADNHILIAGSLCFFSALPFVLFYVRWFPIGNTAAILIGAALMVLTGVVPQREVYTIIGDHGNLRTIYLLLGMMLLFQYFERELLIHSYIFRVNLISFVLAALFTNDAACVIVTPLILRNWALQRRPQSEVDLILLGIATSANIGSVMTIFGNPQMALIASKTAELPFQRSQLDLRRSLFYLGPPAIIVFILNWLALWLYYSLVTTSKCCQCQLTTHKSNKTVPVQLVDEATQTSDPERNRYLRIKALSDIISFPFDQPSATPAITTTTTNNVPPQTIVCHHGVNRERKRSRDELLQPPGVHDIEADFLPSRNRFFCILICVCLLLTVALFLASSRKFTFDMGLVPMLASIIIIAMDALINRRSSVTIMKRVDWGILMMFFGIFVWLNGFNRTKLPRYVWNKLNLGNFNMASDTRQIVLLVTFILIASNIFSNVPLTILILDHLTPCQQQFTLVLFLAWCTTISGNLTLFGSVANLIVANKALESMQVRLTFWKYFKYGFVTTLFFCAFGIVIIFFMLQIPEIHEQI